MSVLVLGGTGEARELARSLDALGIAFVSSLAGRVAHPRLPVGDVRIGGFGGVTGLSAFLEEHDIKAVVDATHPFAATISGNATSACALSGVPLVRLVRPGWSDLPGASRWHWVDTHDDAAALAVTLGDHVFLTTGRQPLGSFVVPLASYGVVVRVVDPPEVLLPPTWTVLLDRGPYALDGELSLMREHRVDVLVTKDSGGDLTRAKLDAADVLGVEVIVVRRPGVDPSVEQVGDANGVVTWLSGQVE